MQRINALTLQNLQKLHLSKSTGYNNNSVENLEFYKNCIKVLKICIKEYKFYELLQ